MPLVAFKDGGGWRNTIQYDTTAEYDGAIQFDMLVMVLRMLIE
jgi:hypothetical protein